MANMALSDLVSAIQGAMLSAQRQGHERARLYSVEYASDDILRLFKIPNFEMDDLEVDVPVYPIEVQTGSPIPTQLIKIVAAQQTLAEKPTIAATRAVMAACGYSLADAKRIVLELRGGERTLKEVTSIAEANAIKQALEQASLKVELRPDGRLPSSADRVAVQPKDLIVATEAKEGVTPMVVKIRLKPHSLSLVQDPAIPGRYTLEAQDR